MKKINVEVEVKEFGCDELSEGDYVEYNDVIYKFLGYEYGTYPIAENIETGETVTLPYY